MAPSKILWLKPWLCALLSLRTCYYTFYTSFLKQHIFDVTYHIFKYNAEKSWIVPIIKNP